MHGGGMVVVVVMVERTTQVLRSNEGNHGGQAIDAASTRSMQCCNAKCTCSIHDVHIIHVAVRVVHVHVVHVVNFLNPFF